ncbi:hybrid sensor histidine kinase/response regulator [Luoshenia tenuis]|jgi:PAS domain S-box-containing protein|uniref:hybrid sensor histidine kinase/response regulator n=1 Tax=Luoshenia tenuis TaxID=2763654 RepID=UPI003D915705
MNWENPLSIEQMAAVLDHAPMAIYVSAADTWELLYANQKARELFLRRPDERGLTCFQAAGYDVPCPFCRMQTLSCQELVEREFYQEQTGRTYRLSGKLIQWAGRKAHIEYITEITAQKSAQARSQALQKQLEKTFSNVPCGLCVYRYDGQRISPVSHNPAFYEIMGYSREHIRQIETETDFLGVHPEDLPELRDKIYLALRGGGMIRHNYRIWNDARGEYRWIRLEGSIKTQEDGNKLLYGVYNDVSEQVRLEKELAAANDKMEDIINAIPGGVAIYKVSDIFETVYFSDGVPGLTGYTVKEYRELTKRDAAEMTFWEDTPMVVARAKEVIRTHEAAEFEFRKQHRDGQIVWVRAQVTYLGEEDGNALLQCVFHNISDLKEAQLEMRHLINSIPGGIASYRVEGGKFIPTFYSDGVMALSGHTREEFGALVGDDALNTVYEQDRPRVRAAANAALASGKALDVSYRMWHKQGYLIWIHLSGRRMGPLTEHTWFYAVFTGMSAEARLFQNIANETADGIYVIDRNNYELLYANESQNLFTKGQACLGQKCYAALHGRDEPCAFCTLKTHPADGTEHEMAIGAEDQFYTTRFRETDWNGIPAYVKYVRDVTEEVHARREKERLELYFQTMVENLPGGVSVMRYDPDGSLTPEYLSEGFAAMTHMTVEQAKTLFARDIYANLHPEDAPGIRARLRQALENGEEHFELTGRFQRGDGAYIWLKNTLSVLHTGDGARRIYSAYADVSKAVAEQEEIRCQYNDLIMQHYRTTDPNALIIGHCNISKNRILEIIDHTGANILEKFGTVREEFFTGVSTLIVAEEERKRFLRTYLNAPTLAAFARNDTEQILPCFIRLPHEAQGRYVQFKVNLVESPDGGEVTGILTVTDITEQTIADRILRQLSVSNYDFVIDLDLNADRYTVLAGNENAGFMPARQGKHSERIQNMLLEAIVPKDQERFARYLEREEMLRRLKAQGTYTFSFSVSDQKGDIRTKNLTVSAIDMRLGRVCLLRTDITKSIREQQGLLNMIAYTFELAGFLNLNTQQLTLYSRRTVLENLPPHLLDRYDERIGSFAKRYGVLGEEDAVEKQFTTETLLRQLAAKPEGYDFVFPYRSGEGVRYKQVIVLWGDQNHRTICMVRADVTDMLAAERQGKKALEEALALAEEANRAKSDFLSAMSHDIRTPMNAIMGMTALAVAHLDDRGRVEDCLRKISISSQHLLSLVNDILDMSKIDRGKITLNHMKITLSELVEQVCAIMGPQARAAGLRFDVEMGRVDQACFYGDSLRINQILINLLSNAVKFTPAGGRVLFRAEEVEAPESAAKARYRFTIQDTGMGMTADFLQHVFEPFTRSRDAAYIEGTGLGLSVTKGLVDLMGGAVAVESQPGGGTTFWVELEGERAHADGKRHAEKQYEINLQLEDQKAFQGRNFLIAEDNAINAEILCELLAMRGAKADVQTDGVKVVRAFSQAQPGVYDAILMDIQMPEMNGYAATRAIRELDRPDSAAIPIIAMTANAFAEDVQASLAAGMTAHVAKPIDMGVLRDTLARVLN